jgi:hypothetical protein
MEGKKSVGFAVVAPGRTQNSRRAVAAIAILETALSPRLQLRRLAPRVPRLRCSPIDRSFAKIASCELD